MDPPGGGFLRPGSKSASAFGLTFDRPHQRGLGKVDREQRVPVSDNKRTWRAADQPASSSSDEDDPSRYLDGDMARAGRRSDGVRGPDLPPLNPSYRYGDLSLPVSRYRRQILYLVEHHATTILVGETGSGKSTQVPQFLYEAGWADGGYCIAVTQPRRVAVTTVASRVAEEMGCDVGTTVGYAVRFDNAIKQGRTKIKFLTDGVLLREMLEDPLLTSYSVIMVDEAHERSLATDMLLGLIKKVQRRRPDLRLIVSSATLEASQLRDFFNTATTATNTAAAAMEAAARRQSVITARVGAGAGEGGQLPPLPDPLRCPAVISVEGRTHPVQIHYLESPTSDYVRGAVEAVVGIHCEDLPGDVLVFLTGQEEVQSAVSQLEEHARRLAGSRGYSTRLLPLPLYAGLPGPQQQVALRPAPRGFRKVVVATNVAETSLTLEGVVYVVDCCFVKQRCYNPVAGLESLLVAPVSRASAAQRAGRAGRVRAGHCFRLCTQEDFEKLQPFTVPEMQRSNLVAMVLQLKALGIDNVMRFEWLAPPPAEAMVRALEELHALKVLDDDARLTRDVGLALSCLPLDPPLGAALLAAVGLGCVEELLTLTALMSVGPLWAPAQGAMRALDESKSKFAAAEGDGVTLLNVHRAWRASGRSAAWAHRHFLHPAALYRADEARDQLLATMRRYGLLPYDKPPPSSGQDMEPVCRALAAGLFANAAVFSGTQYNPLAPEGDPGTHTYRLVRYTQQKTHPIKLRIHNSSVLWRTTPACVVYNSVQQTDKGWYEMQGVTAVRPDWLTELAPHMFHRPSPV